MPDSESKLYQERIELFSKVNELAVSFNNANPSSAKMVTIDFRDDDIFKFFRSLQDKEVKYLLVGGFAMAFHGYVRATHDLDLWIKDEVENLEKLKKVFSENEVQGLEKVKSLQLVAGFTELKVGTSGFVVDPMTNLKAFNSFDFDACYQRAKEGEFKGIHFKVIHAMDLLKEKEATNRPKDQADIEHLRKFREEGNADR
jgi:predicted nucleotidyltransferase